MICIVLYFFREIVCCECRQRRSPKLSVRFNRIFEHIIIIYWTPRCRCTVRDRFVQSGGRTQVADPMQILWWLPLSWRRRRRICNLNIIYGASDTRRITCVILYYDTLQIWVLWASLSWRIILEIFSINLWNVMYFGNANNFSIWGAYKKRVFCLYVKSYNITYNAGPSL